MGATTVEAELSFWAPLRVAAYRRALLGRFVSAMGSWMQTVAAGWLVYRLTHSAAAVGVLTVLSRGPGILLSTYGGELAERFGARRMTILLYGVQALPAAALALAVWDGRETALQVYAATFAIGVAGALASAPAQALVVESVPDELRRRATAFGSMTYNAARMIGPALGGLLIVWSGPGVCFALNAVSFAAVVVTSATLPRSVPKPSADRVGMRALLAQGRRHPELVELLGTMALFLALVAPVQELAPTIADRHGEGAHLLGFLLAALALGGVLGNWVRLELERRGVPRERTVAAVLVLSGASLVALAASAFYPIALVAMLLCGTLWDVLFVESLTAMQTEAGEHGALFTGVFFAISLLGVTVGTLLVGLLFDVAGIEIGLAVCAATLWAYALARVRWTHAPAPA